MEPTEKEIEDTGVVDPAPEQQPPEDNGLPPDPSEQKDTPPKLIAGKYKTVEEAEKGIQEAERKMHEALEARKQAETERAATMETLSRLPAQAANQDGKKGPTLEELKEQLREDPSKILDIVFERDQFWMGQLAQKESEIQARLTEFDPAYVQVKEDVVKLQKLHPDIPREKLVGIVTMLRQQGAIPTDEPSRPEPSQRASMAGMNGRRSAPSNVTPFKLGRDTVAAMRNFGLTDAEILEEQKARAAR